MDSAVSQVAALVKRYIDGQIALHEVEDVSLPLLWDTDESDIATTQFLGRIHNLIAERSRGDRTEESIRLELANAVRPFVVHAILWERPDSIPIERKTRASTKPRKVRVYRGRQHRKAGTSKPVSANRFQRIVALAV